jgi:hypothetical protein
MVEERVLCVKGWQDGLEEDKTFLLPPLQLGHERQGKLELSLDEIEV